MTVTEQFILLAKIFVYFSSLQLMLVIQIRQKINKMKMTFAYRLIFRIAIVPYTDIDIYIIIIITKNHVFESINV